MQNGWRRSGGVGEKRIVGSALSGGRRTMSGPDISSIMHGDVLSSCHTRLGALGPVSPHPGISNSDKVALVPT